MMPDVPVSEEELHGFIDGQLPAEREPVVRAYLAANPAEAQRVDAYTSHRAALRAAMAAFPETPPPRQLDLAHIAAEVIRRQRRFQPWQMAAALLLAAGIGGLGGWLYGRPVAPSRNVLAAALLTKQAIATYSVFGADPAHPVEFTAAELPVLTHYLSDRLRRPVEPPSLDSVGFHLIGGRIVATEYGSPAALFVYKNESGDRISLLLRPMSPDLHSPPQSLAAKGVGGRAWIEHGMGYAVVGSDKTGDLGRVEHQIRKEPT